MDCKLRKFIQVTFTGNYNLFLELENDRRDRKAKISYDKTEKSKEIRNFSKREKDTGCRKVPKRQKRQKC